MNLFSYFLLPLPLMILAISPRAAPWAFSFFWSVLISFVVHGPLKVAPKFQIETHTPSGDPPPRGSLTLAWIKRRCSECRKNDLSGVRLLYQSGICFVAAMAAAISSVRAETGLALPIMAASVIVAK